MSQLHTLSRIVHPEEVDVERGLDDSEDYADRVRLLVVRVQLPPDPVENVECAVAAKGKEVEGVDYGWDGGLAEKQELGEDADGFEDYAEDPEDLL